MAKALYPGTFDPLTCGHLDIIERAAGMFDELIVAIMLNPRKKCFFKTAEREMMIKKCIGHLKNVHVTSSDGLTVKLAKEYGCHALVRGIRAIADYEYELAQATSNMYLDKDIETVFLVSKPEFSFLSSSIAKEVALFGGDLSHFIPEPIKDEVLLKLTGKNNL